MRLHKLAVLDFISIVLLYGVIAYSNQILGFYAMLQIMGASIWKIWVAVIGVGIRFLLQVSIIGLFIWVTLGYRIGAGEVKSAFVPLLAAGVFCTIMRFIGYFVLINVYFVPLRSILESISMTAGWFLSLYLLGKEISLDPSTITKKYAIVFGIGLLVYFVFPPV
ncbi:hypothetical protein [Thermococcus sp. 21S7]|uniref:hypothetical protein n=1 Tax=Thermococcus sp. 21S7 TaxID=1638221 RepID=UPI00143C215A|nr:hypothetical protein [Thermococcus sp. 21S7]NJE61851.1 hypothetical protein [Thermococcus sp. 21S7]